VQLGLENDYANQRDPLPTVGLRRAVVDSRDRRVAVIEMTEVRVVPLAEVELQHVIDEGEGDESVAQWRAGHEMFWNSPEVRAELGAGFMVDDETPVVVQRFRLIRVVPE
jgi:uncharacterized protein YhfF